MHRDINPSLLHRLTEIFLYVIKGIGPKHTVDAMNRANREKKGEDGESWEKTYLAASIEEKRLIRKAAAELRKLQQEKNRRQR